MAQHSQLLGYIGILCFPMNGIALTLLKLLRYACHLTALACPEFSYYLIICLQFIVITLSLLELLCDVCHLVIE